MVAQQSCPLFDHTLQAHIEVARSALKAVDKLGDVVPRDIHNAIVAVTAPTTVRASFVDLQRVLVDGREEDAVLGDDRRIAILERTEPANIVVTVAFLVLASIEHVILIQLLPVAQFAHNGPRLAQVLADPASVYLQLVISFVAFDVDLVVVDAELGECLELFLLVLFEFGLQVLNAVVRFELAVRFVGLEELLTVLALLLVVRADLLVGLDLSFEELYAAAIGAELWPERAGLQVFECLVVRQASFFGAHFSFSCCFLFLLFRFFILYLSFTRSHLCEAASFRQAASLGEAAAFDLSCRRLSWRILLLFWFVVSGSGGSLPVVLIRIRMVFALLHRAIKPHIKQRCLDQSVHLRVSRIRAPVWAVARDLAPLHDAVAAVGGVASRALFRVYYHLEADLAHEVVFRAAVRGGQKVAVGRQASDDLSRRELLKLLVVFYLLISLLVVLIKVSKVEHICCFALNLL